MTPRPGTKIMWHAFLSTIRVCSESGVFSNSLDPFFPPFVFPSLSVLRCLGADALNYTQRTFGGRIYFNPFVKMDGLLLKYGVIQKADLIEDLQCWSSLYVAGRLHKWVSILFCLMAEWGTGY